jgi:hypothetical protein
VTDSLAFVHVSRCACWRWRIGRKVACLGLLTRPAARGGAFNPLVSLFHLSQPGGDTKADERDGELLGVVDELTGKESGFVGKSGLHEEEEIDNHTEPQEDSDNPEGDDPESHGLLSKLLQDTECQLLLVWRQTIQYRRRPLTGFRVFLFGLIARCAQHLLRGYSQDHCQCVTKVFVM